MSAEIIQLMPSPRRDGWQTDFPAIAFRSAVPVIATDQRNRSTEISPNAHGLDEA